MSYSIQRKLRAWAQYWQDPEGRNPSTVSEAPVQAVGLVNTAFESAVYAWSHTTLNGPGTMIPEWQYSREIDTGENPFGVPLVSVLPGGFVWNVFHVAVAQEAPAQLRVSRVTPNGATTVVGRWQNLPVTTGSGITDCEFIPGIGAGATGKNDIPHLLLPFGGQLIHINGGGGDNAMTLYAVGHLRGSAFT